MREGRETPTSRRRGRARSRRDATRATGRRSASWRPAGTWRKIRA